MNTHSLKIYIKDYDLCQNVFFFSGFVCPCYMVVWAKKHVRIKYCASVQHCVQASLLMYAHLPYKKGSLCVCLFIYVFASCRKKGNGFFFGAFCNFGLSFVTWKPKRALLLLSPCFLKKKWGRNCN